MRLSRDITGWAFTTEVDGVRHAGLAVGPPGVSPFTGGAGSGGSLFTRAHGWWGLPALLSLNDLPLDHPVDHRWCVTRDDEGVLSVIAPDGTPLVYDLRPEEPPGWRETAVASGSVMLVVSHVLPAGDDPIGALDLETRRGMVCAGPVRFGEPDHTPRHDEDGAPTARFLIDPVGTLMELAQYVCDGILSLSRAKRRARDLERTRQALAKDADRAVTAEAMLRPLFRDEFLDHRGPAEFVYVYWGLVVEVADACGAEAARRDAALRTVEAAVPLVADRCEREVFEEADALASRLIDEPGDPTETEAVLSAAARLRLATRGPEDLAADHYARGTRTLWAARLEADLYRTWVTDEAPLQAESHRLVAEAGELVLRALESEAGTRRPRLLALLAQILADEEGVHRDAAAAALTAWLDSPTADDPDLALFLLRVVDGVPPDLAGGLPRAVFGASPADFVATHGHTPTARVIGQGVNLARERADRSLLRTVLDWAERLDLPRGPAHRRQLIEARLHVLPDDPTDCPAPGSPLPDLSPEALRARSPWQRSAALLHAAAHARDLRQPALGLTLLRQAGDAGGGEGVRLLTADLHDQAAEMGEPGPGPVPFPWGYRTYAALGYASLGFEEAARASLVPFVRRIGDLRGEELEAALFAIIVDVPNFDTSRAPELGRVLRDLVHSAMWQLTTESETLPMGLMLGLHQAGKGPEWGAWWRIDGPLALPTHIQHLLGRLRDLEDPASPRGASGTGSPLLNTLDSDPRPDGHDTRQIARNLRRRVSSLIDDELSRRSAPFVDDRHLWAKAQELLDERTVLLTWFLPAAVNGAAVLLAVTRRDRTLVVHLGDGTDGNHDRHPVADRVEAIRTEIERDPLFGDVTPEGHRLLRQPGDIPLGGAELWEEWRARGKDRILAWPHGALHYLPLPLCRTGDRMIADDWTVTTIAGLEALIPATGPVRPPRTVVLASADGGVPHGLHAEPLLEDHAREVARAVGTDAVTGAAATRERLLTELATADVVHIAAHGTLDRDAPWMHCLHLTPDHDDDGRVFAHDFLETDLRGVRLVTLAACESGLGRFDRADNVRGIPSALITAGAQAVVGCLWPVRPEPATHFHHHLHRRIARGIDPERAFREAQLATRARYPHYRDWGAFTHLRGRSKGAVA
ncbi:CHAT domain-containing protein [Streptomyces calidiresistens]|uniref:CHAT domain-containing protein n=1 Tax=Streptomyces calidiresistens TaxID=1485586 RepID=A0A7W3T025_9ACTN|nr:CHAT domain-containing protein [Streptomyces calidiresistens]MBB0228385.1 CHAT domain-containing protein [Streptomyces calidiresistens]